MKRSTIFLFGVLSTFITGSASAAEVMLSCDYELGAEVSAQRRKIGSVVVAIDVAAKSARIDFGKGWFKPMSLLVDGSDVKETSPPSNGAELGYFYFDLTQNSGGFKSENDPHEFFDGCVRTSLPAGTNSAVLSLPRAPAIVPGQGQQAAVAPAERLPTAKPSPSAKPSLPSAAGHVAPQKSAEESIPKNAVPAAKPLVAPKQEAQAAAPPAAVAPVPPPARPIVAEAELVSPLADVHGATEYFGDRSSHVDLGPVIVAPVTEVEAPRKAVAEAPPASSSVSAAGPIEPEPHLAVEDGTTEYFGDGARKISMPPAAVIAQIEAPHVVAAPSSPGAPVQHASIELCRDALSVEVRGAKVNFANASFDPEPSSQAELTKIARMMKECGDVALEVGGHTDNLGYPAWNKLLSQQRANAVVQFLVKQGASASSLKAVGYGVEQPIATNETDEGRRLNRRVEFRISAH